VYRDASTRAATWAIGGGGVGLETVAGATSSTSGVGGDLLDQRRSSSSPSR
jgi:hypothetical protein